MLTGQRAAAGPIVKIFITFHEHSHEGTIGDLVGELGMLQDVPIKFCHQVGIFQFKRVHGKIPNKNLCL